MAVNDIHRVAIEGLFEGQRCYMTRHFRIAQVGSVGVPDAILAAEIQQRYVLLAGPAVDLTQLTTAAITFTKIISLKVAPAPTGGVFELPIAHPGTVAGDHLPSTNSVCISLYSTLGGKSGRGRIYLPCVPRSSVTASTINGIAMIDYQAWANILDDIITDSTAPIPWKFEPVIFSRKRFLLGMSPWWGAITTALVRPVVATQRRRRLGAGV